MKQMQFLILETLVNIVNHSAASVAIEDGLMYSNALIQTHGVQLE